MDEETKTVKLFTEIHTVTVLRTHNLTIVQKGVFFFHPPFLISPILDIPPFFRNMQPLPTLHSLLTPPIRGKYQIL